LVSKHAEIQYLGFPFSISENFQMRNTHKTIAESLLTLQEILEIADTSNKEVVAYLQWVWQSLWRFVEYRDRRRVDREISFYGVKIYHFRIL
jgi:hypothetical protein